ncbi:MAG: helix-turn-helix domain-containing protein [Pseudomonadota bacterium]
MESLSLSWRTAILLFGALQGLITAAGLLAVPVNRNANRFAAFILFVFILWMTPQIIGFAGFYQAFPWLTYLPTDWGLGYGAAIFLYCWSLVYGRLPRYWPLLFVPLVLQVAYYSILFTWPTADKWAWDDAVHMPYVEPVEAGASLLFGALGVAFGWRLVHRYRHWLREHVSNNETHDPRWVHHYFYALVVTLAWAIVEYLYRRFIGPVSYEGGYPFYVWVSAITYWLGLEAWRHARIVNPPMQPTSSEDDAKADRLGELASRIRDRVESEALFRDPSLTLASLARHVASNTSSVSAAINTVFGKNFSDFVNEYRVDTVKASMLESPGNNMLDLALDAGFSSKTSFNRVFKAMTGQTPSAWRAASAKS